MNRTPSPSYAWQHTHPTLATNHLELNKRKHLGHPALTQDLGEPQTWTPEEIEENASIRWLESSRDEYASETQDDFDAVPTPITRIELQEFVGTRFDGAQTIDQSYEDIWPQQEWDVWAQQKSDLLSPKGSDLLPQQVSVSMPSCLAEAESALSDPWFLDENDGSHYAGMSPGMAFWAGVSFACVGFILWCLFLFVICL